MCDQQTDFHDVHFKKIARDESWGLVQNSTPSRNEFRQRGNSVGLQEVFVHTQPIEFVIIVAEKGICTIIATRNLTQ